MCIVVILRSAPVRYIISRRLIFRILEGSLAFHSRRPSGHYEQLEQRRQANSNHLQKYNALRPSMYCQDES